MTEGMEENGREGRDMERQGRQGRQGREGKERAEGKGEMERQGRQWGRGGRGKGEEGEGVEWREILGPVALNLSLQHTSQPRRRQTSAPDLCGMICLSKCFPRRDRNGRMGRKENRRKEKMYG